MLSLLYGMSMAGMRDYDTLVKRIESCYEPGGREAALRQELNSIRRKPGQEAAEWAQEVERQVLRAYPTADNSLKEMLSIDGIRDQAARHWLQLTTPTNLQQAMLTCFITKAFSLQIKPITPRSQETW